ncbi:hypothetical protein E4U40_006313 [Claviceps sp. LM458 group G5]|nr:hypothetical protein E4U40_006313 [Claviceps sp. LM458 group G5]
MTHEPTQAPNEDQDQSQTIFNSLPIHFQPLINAKWQSKNLANIEAQNFSFFRSEGDRNVVVFCSSLEAWGNLPVLVKMDMNA